MDLIYSGMDYKGKKKTIFLAGPTPRDKNITSWRFEAIEIFKKLGYKDSLIIPEKLGKHYYEEIGNYDEIVWDFDAICSADIVMMWIPRNKDMLGLSTNVEFGYLLNKGNLIYGRPDNAFRCEFLDYLYKKEQKKEPINNLEDLIKETIKYLD